MRVLHVITGLNSGGAETAMFRVVTGTPDTSTAVVSLTGMAHYGSLLEARGVAVTALGLNLRRPWPGALLRLYALLRRERPDVVQTWLYHADLLGGLTARAAGVRGVVWGIHAASLEPSSISRTTRRVARLGARVSGVVPRAVICCSEPARAAHEAFGYHPDRLTIVENGIDMAAFLPDEEARRSGRARLGLDEGTFVLGMVGRWDPVKDHLGFLRALSDFHARTGPAADWCALLVGDGVDEANAVLRSAIASLGLEGRVRCLGATTDVPAFMNVLDIHVLPSRTESFGLVTVEAMACGTPGIATDVGLAREIVGDVGWVVPHSDSERLGRAVEKAYAAWLNPEGWARRAAAGRARVEGRFGVERMVEGYEAVWRSVA